MTSNEEIVAQFTKMAGAFASAPPIVDGQALDLLLEQTGASSSDDSLDVACGAGVVTCHFASVVNSATGIDITPAMIERAKSLQTRRGLNNARWDLGDVTQLPYTEGSFSIVTCRYAFHHMPNPAIQDSLMRHFRSMQANADLANICVEWYRPPPKKVPSFIEIANQHGSQSRASHSPVRVTGAW